MNGLKKAIRDNLPESWDKILRKHKCLTKFIDYAYESLPSYMKGGEYYKNDTQRPKRRKFKLGLNRVLHMYANAPIYNCFCGKFLNIDGINWENLWKEIKEYENNCK